ncbi:unnamed protein product [Mesocestoides corti]|nr:unnamed protein product [Mesocestoides corti]
MPVNRPRVRRGRSLNISALLASGDFYIDDNGYLVSVSNGTRYRLPSGPPEGRSGGPFELQPILPGKNQQLADSAVEWFELTTAKTASPSTSLAKTRLPPSLNSTSGEYQSTVGTLQLSLALVACSVALMANLGLVSISCWHLFRSELGQKQQQQNRRSTNSISLQPIRPPEGVFKTSDFANATTQSERISLSSEELHSSSISLSSDDSRPRQRVKKVMPERQKESRPFTNARSCLGIGAHIGLLGVVLAFVHLTVTCFHLTQTPLSTVLCLLVTSIAMDTLLCVQLHLISCFLCLVLIGFLSHVSASPSGQQRFACLALSHSLPWALAAGSALFITLRPSEASVHANIFFTGFDTDCDIKPSTTFQLSLIALLVITPLVGEIMLALLLVCCCKQIKRLVSLIVVLLPVLNCSCLIPVIAARVGNLTLLPLAVEPILLLMLYHLLFIKTAQPPLPPSPQELQRIPTTTDLRSPLHQVVSDESPSLASDMFFPQTILAITPHRCSHTNSLRSASPSRFTKLCPHYQQILHQQLKHPHTCCAGGSFEMNDRTDVFPATDILNNMSASSTNPATAAVMAAAAAAVAASAKHRHHSDAPHLHPVPFDPAYPPAALLLHSPGVVHCPVDGSVAAPVLDQHAEDALESDASPRK